MITITVEEGNTSLKMDGTDKKVFAEATVIVNALYTAFRNDNPVLGETFRYAVRHMDYVWESESKVTESITIAIPNTDAGK